MSAFNSSILFGMLEVIKKGRDSRTGVSPEAEGRAAKQSLEVCQPVRNAPAARCTMPSRTAGSAVQDMNARAARSTSGASCTMPSRTGSLPVQNENARAARSTSGARCTADSRTAGSAVQNESNERAGRAFYYEFPDAMATASEHFFSRFAQADVHTRNLPHWAANKSLIFITYRLADSMPAAKLRVWQDERDEWLRLHPEPWDAATASEYYETFSAKLDEMLDAGYGSCILGREDCRNIVMENLLHFNGERYVLHSFVVMPNHVHVLVEIERREDSAKIVQGWKSYTSKRINEVVGSEGQVWQREYYDRLIRNAEHYERTVEYIRKNARVAEGLISRTGCQPVRNAPAARCTTDSRTAGSAVQENAPAARSTIAARCTTDSRTGCQPVQEDNIFVSERIGKMKKIKTIIAFTTIPCLIFADVT